jgi:hypothetical protein
VVSEPTIPPYSNTKEVIIVNLDTTLRLWVAFGDPTGGALTAATSIVLLPLAAITLAIWPEGDRNPLETGGGVAKMNLLLQSADAAIEVNITYVNSRGINDAGGF